MNDLEKQYKALPLKARIEMALSDSAPENYRLFLAEDQWSVIRCYFSRREDLNPDEVAIMIKDDDYVIRLSIAKRNDLTNEQVAQCVIDADPNVRHAIARNILLSERQRQILLNDEDDLIRRSAQKGPRKIKFRQRKNQARLIK